MCIVNYRMILVLTDFVVLHNFSLSKFKVRKDLN